ncbi:MAG: cold shock domain-containing protein [Chloroflexota bacterium]|nr:cold shock domain-containing protein [Chloroflexota bacterium]
MPGSGRQRGTIKFFNARRGWGFIIGTGGGQVFFHRSGLQEGNKPGEGDLVEFAVEATSRGPQATGIISL